jgi:group I intron endonuclease
MQIYKVINKINGKWYIGKDVSDRPYYYGSGKALKNAIVKYGKENFEKIILETCKSKEDLIEREKHWIAITNATLDKMSYNIASGGEGGDLSEHIDYKKRGYNGDRFFAAQEKIRSMSATDRKEFYAKQGESRSKTWFVSRLETP